MPSQRPLHFLNMNFSLVTSQAYQSVTTIAQKSFVVSRRQYSAKKNARPERAMSLTHLFSIHFRERRSEKIIAGMPKSIATTLKAMTSLEMMRSNMPRMTERRGGQREFTATMNLPSAQ